MNGDVQSALYRRILDAMPSWVFVLDRSLRILDANRAARETLGEDLADKRLCGDALACMNADASGCGASEACPECVVRVAVDRAVNGRATVRESAKMGLRSDGRVRNVWFLVSTSPLDHDGRSAAMVVLEEITELMELRRLVPICSHCRRVRDDQEFWQDVEAYLLKHTAVEFTHGICPDCLKKHYQRNGG